MKRFISTLMVLAMAVMLTACGRLEENKTVSFFRAAENSGTGEKVLAGAETEKAAKVLTKENVETQAGADAAECETSTEEEPAADTGAETEKTGHAPSEEAAETAAGKQQATQGWHRPVATAETEAETETAIAEDDSAQEHVHSYTSKITKAATCGSPGIRTYTCSCGDTYQEEIPATEKHSWQEVTETIYHEAETESRWVMDSEAWDETVEIQVPVYEERAVCVVTCRGCGMQFTGGTHGELVKACHMHIINEHDNMCGYGQEDSYWETVQTGTETKLETVHHEEEGHWENVVVKQAWSETVVTGHVCTTCGLEK